MDHCKTDEDSCNSSPNRQRNEGVVNNGVAARKVQKADREKLRRDKLNEQFHELGNLLDPDRPKTDKASILTDAMQVLKDLNSHVNRLKAEHAVLCEESKELTQEKNELRREKISLKSDIQNLKTQHHQSQRFMIPWATVDPPIVMAAPFLHPLALQPLPFISQTQHSDTPNPCSTFIPYLTTVNPQLDQPTTLNVSNPYISQIKNSMPMSFDPQTSSSNENVDNSYDFPTDLELKVAGSAVLKEEKQETGKQPKKQHEKNFMDGSCSSNCSSSQNLCGSSSNSVDGIQ